MTEVNTFSALIDDAVARTGRRNLRNDIIAYARQSLRECQIIAEFNEDMTEDTITATADPHIWTKPQYFRKFRRQGVRFGIANLRGELIYPKQVQPSQRQQELDYYYYHGADYVVFKGVQAGVQIDVAYFSFFRKLPYYEIAARPATFSLETETWSYLTAVSDAEKEAARALVTNWLLFDWYDMILEGTVAKVLKAVGDPRAPSSFALFKSLQNQFEADKSITTSSDSP